MQEATELWPSDERSLPPSRRRHEPHDKRAPCAKLRAIAIPRSNPSHSSLPVPALPSSVCFGITAALARVKLAPNCARSRTAYAIRHALLAGAARRGHGGAGCARPARSERADVLDADAERRDGLPCALRPRGEHARRGESELLREFEALFYLRPCARLHDATLTICPSLSSLPRRKFTPTILPA